MRTRYLFYNHKLIAFASTVEKSDITAEIDNPQACIGRALSRRLQCGVGPKKSEGEGIFCSESPWTQEDGGENINELPVSCGGRSSAIAAEFVCLFLIEISRGFHLSSCAIHFKRLTEQKARAAIRELTVLCHRLRSRIGLSESKVPPDSSGATNRYVILSW
jgi:hypothetical protein